ncbi:unnamed protein product, partial [Albugo candida]
GFYIKLAQAGSTRADFLPSQYLTRAVKLQDEAPSKPVSEIKNIISQSFQTSWDNIFTSIDPKPLGAASIGQAHRAILKDSGEEVAVKVQHPDAEHFFRSDMKTIKAFCRYFQPAHLPYLEEVEKQFMTEFNYHEEALNLEMVRDNLKKSPFASRVAVPTPKIEFCTKEVLVMEYLRGKKLLVGIQEHLECIAKERGMSLEELRTKQQKMDEERLAKGLDITLGPTQFELKALAVKRWIRLRYLQLLNCMPGNLVSKPLEIDCDKELNKKLLNVPSILKLLMDVHGYEIFVDGCFNGDPHPGNILLLEDGRIGLIDYGQVKRISLEHRIKLAKLTVALAEGSREDIVHALTVEMGVRSAKMNSYFLEKQARLMFDRDDLTVTEGMNVQSFVEYLDSIDQIVQVPDEYIMAFRASLLLRGFSYALHYRYSHSEAWASLAKQVIAENATRELAKCKVESLNLPRPQLHEPNPSFRTIETWPQLVHLVCTRSIRISSLGYYQSLQAVTIHVFRQKFDHILNEIQSVDLPLQLRFVYVPVRSLHQLEEHENVYKLYGSTNRLQVLHEKNVQDDVNWQSNIAKQYLHQNKLRRDHSVRSQTALSILGSVFTELIGMKGTKVRNFFFPKGKKMKPLSWDAYGAFGDIFTTGFYTFLPSSLKCSQIDSLNKEHDKQDPQLLSNLGKLTGVKSVEIGGIGVWSTTFGGYQLSLCIGHIGDSEAAVLQRSLKNLNANAVDLKVENEQSLKRGSVLVSINGESTFGKRFTRVAEMLIGASRPTTLCFRVFQDHKCPINCTENVETECSSEIMLALLSEAHRDMTNSLQVAMLENAAIRAKCDSIEQRVWKLEAAACTERNLLNRSKKKLAAASEECIELQKLVQKRDNLINELQDRNRCLETKLKHSQHIYEMLAERARSQALEQIANQEAKLLNESNKSIELLQHILEEKFMRERDSAIQRMKSQHEEFLQKLAEEHCEEVENLNQQVAVWRHQVDVLTEAERRNYTNGHNSPGHMYSLYTPRRIDYSTLTSSTGSSTSEPKIQFPPAKIEIEKGFVKCEGLSVSEQNKAMVCTNTSSELYKCKMACTPPGSSTESNENSLLSEVKEYCREGNRYKFCMETNRHRQEAKHDHIYFFRCQSFSSKNAQQQSDTGRALYHRNTPHLHNSTLDSLITICYM